MPRDAVDLVTHTHEDERSGGVAYYCAQCGQFMTRARLGIRMNGEHEHVLFNPAGILFRVVCFSDAPGAVAVGNASHRFTWFAGFTWRIALCKGCGIHVGWMYEGAGAPAVFFGLIRSMLVERPG
ncbi:MAG TPA: cereblon family protein [Magnetospirillum sp.]|nr:cereblon family protein [Magnetospirillum sp.]